MKKPQFRIVRFVRHEKEYGYEGLYEHQYNCLQVRLTNIFSILMNGGKWKTIEEEHIPSFAWIQAGTLGSTDWKSELIAKHQDKLEMA